MELFFSEKLYFLLYSTPCVENHQDHDQLSTLRGTTLNIKRKTIEDNPDRAETGVERSFLHSGSFHIGLAIALFRFIVIRWSISMVIFNLRK
jgi:hypothetical protein